MTIYLPSPTQNSRESEYSFTCFFFFFLLSSLCLWFIFLFFSSPVQALLSFHALLSLKKFQRREVNSGWVVIEFYARARFLFVHVKLYTSVVYKGDITALNTAVYRWLQLDVLLPANRTKNNIRKFMRKKILIFDN